VSDEVNWIARQKFIQLAAEIFEVLKYNVKQDGNTFNQVNIHMTQEDKENRIKRIILMTRKLKLSEPEE